jgi:hypothetical protein
MNITGDAAHEDFIIKLIEKLLVREGVKQEHAERISRVVTQVLKNHE